MGGVCPLGYDVKDRKLVINEPEAETVRSIFGLYLERESVLSLEAELDRRGVRSKLRRRGDGTSSGGQSLTRGALYTLLQNRMYVGQICRRGTAYPGQHAPIMDEGLFAEAQTLLARNRADRKLGTNYDHLALLAGLVWDADSRRMSPAHSTKGPARYRYYGTRPDPGGGKAAVRVAAADLERVVINRLASFLRSRREVHDLLEPWNPDAVTLQAALFAATEAEKRLASGTRRERARFS